MDKFVVETNRKVVGIAIRAPAGFRFVCSDPDFRSLDRKIFPRARALAACIADLARNRTKSEKPKYSRAWPNR